METITRLEPGDAVIATTASGKSIGMRVVRAPEAGRDFPVVWLTTEQEFAKAKADGVAPDAVPWPLDAVAPAPR